jgi:glutamate racemase
MNDAPIGIFDSGKGGLTVLEQIKQQLPYESVICYGDVARIPYGARSAEEIINFNYEIISYLIERGAKMVIIACNTSSAVAIEADQTKFSIPINGLIHPGARAALERTRDHKIGIAATQRTVSSHAYRRQIEKIWAEKRTDKNAQQRLEVLEVACPEFVPLVEAGKTSGPEVRSAIKKYFKVFREKGVDTVVHGCTHYPFLEKEMKDYLGDKVSFVDPAVDTVKEAKQIMQQKGLLSVERTPGYEYVISKKEGERYVRVDGREYFFSSTPAYR